MPVQPTDEPRSPRADVTDAMLRWVSGRTRPDILTHEEPLMSPGAAASVDEIAEAAGLRTTMQRLTFADAQLLATPDAPCSARLGTGWLVLTGSGPGREHFVVSLVDDQLHARQLESADLESAVDWPSDHTTEWWQFEAATPCELASATPQQPTMPPLQRLLRLLHPDRGDILSVVVFAIATGVLLLATPVAVQAIVSVVAFGSSIPPLLVVAGLLMLGLAFAAALTATQTWIVEILQRRLFVRMVSDLAARLPRVTLAARGHGYGPELVNRYFDIVTIQKVGSTLLLDGLGVLLSVLVGLVVLAFYHPLLLAFDVVLLAVIALLVLGPARRGIATAIKESKSKYAVAAWLEEIARNPVNFKAASTQRWVLEESDRLTHSYLDARQRHYRVVFGQVVGALLLQVLASTALLAIGGLLVIEGSLTLGQLVAAELIVTTVVSSVSKMGKHLEGYYDLLAAVDKVGQLLDLPTERVDGELPPPSAGPARVDLRRVQSVATPTPISLVLEPGERLGVTGESGTGKAELLEILWGLHPTAGGSVLLDGRDVRDLAPTHLRQAASLVSRPEIVARTLRENIRFGRTYISDDDLRWATRLTGLEPVVERLPDGLDTMLAADGHPLALGEMQSLFLARAVASRPRLLLFGGSLDLLPAGDRQRVLDALFDRATPWTLVIATQSDEVLRRCDRLLCLPTCEVTEPPTDPHSPRTSP